jgi:orotate phosphoribosyltransferase
MTFADAAFAESRARLLALMRRLAYERRPVTLSSGRTSDFYIDTKQAVLTAEGHFLVGQLLLNLIEREVAAVEAVGGLTMGADPLASAVSLMSHIAGRPRAAFYVRKEPKGHGTASWIEGAKSLRPGMKVAILEDVITTGASALKAISRARLSGLEIVRVFAIVDREEEGGREAIAAEAPVTSLFARSDFL